MRSKVAAIQQAAGFERVLEALGQELIESTDEELFEAAKELGMDPTMRGSAAFIGLRYPAIPGMADFFAIPAVLSKGISSSKARLPNRKKRR